MEKEKYFFGGVLSDIKCLLFILFLISQVLGGGERRGGRKKQRAGEEHRSARRFVENIPLTILQQCNGTDCKTLHQTF